MAQEYEKKARASANIEALKKAWANLPESARIQVIDALVRGYLLKDESENSQVHRNESTNLLVKSGFLEGNKNFHGQPYNGESKWVERRLNRLEKGLLSGDNYQVFRTFHRFFTIIDEQLNDEYLHGISSLVTKNNLELSVSTLSTSVLANPKVRGNPLYPLYLPVLQVFAPHWFSDVELEKHTEALEAIETACKKIGRDMPFAIPVPCVMPDSETTSVIRKDDAMPVESAEEYRVLNAEVEKMLASLISGPDSPDYDLFIGKTREIREKAQNLNEQLRKLMMQAGIADASWHGLDEYGTKHIETLAAIEAGKISSEQAKLEQLWREWRQALANWIRAQRARGMGDVNRPKVIAAADELAGAAEPEGEADFPGRDSDTPIAWWGWWQGCVASGSGSKVLDILRTIWRLELLADVLENEILNPELPASDIESEPISVSPQESQAVDLARATLPTSGMAPSVTETREKGQSTVSGRLTLQKRKTFPNKIEFINTHSSLFAEKLMMSPWAGTKKEVFREAAKNRLAAELSLDNPEPDFRRIMVEHRALWELDTPNIYDTNDLRDALEILRLPERSQGAWGRGRIQRLLTTKEGDVSLRLGLCLEALRPSEELEGVQSKEIIALVKVASFSTPHLQMIVEKLLLEGNRGRLIEDTRRRIGKNKPIGIREAREQLNTKREELQSQFQQGSQKFKVSHCIAAWTKFLNWLTPILHPLFPGQMDWSFDEKRPLLQKITEQHTRIADQEDVRYKYRKNMDNRARKIQELAIEVNQLMRKCVDLGNKNSQDGEDDVLVLRQGMKSLFEDRDVVDPTEILEWRLLYAVFASDLQQTPIHYSGKRASDYFTEEDIFAFPGILAFNPDDVDWPRDRSKNPDKEMFSVESLLGAGQRSPAVACRLSEILSAVSQENTITSMQDLEAFLRNEGCRELLGRLPHRSEDRPVAFNEWEADLFNRADQCYQKLVIARGLFSALARMETNQIKELIACAKAIPHWKDDDYAEDTANGYASIRETARLFGLSREIVLNFEIAWLEEAVLWVDALLKDESTRLKEYALRQNWNDERRNDFLRYLEDKDFARVLLVMGEEDTVDDVPGRHRETHWRAEAETKFSKPEHFLNEIGGDSSTEERLKEAIKYWIKGGNYTELREAFGNWVLSSYAKNKHPLANIFRRPARKIAEKFSERNPTFLPQLSQFDSFAIVVPETRASDPYFKKQTMRLLHGLTTKEKCLIAVLAPKCAPQTRNEVLGEFRRFETHIAGIVDDIDFCRLIRRGGSAIDPTVGLLEILLEQRRDISFLSPYKPVEGQNVKVEMYVGRRSQAEALAMESQYTRLFSGRKLGKSALLKYTQYMCESKVNLLRSGNRLHVVYILGNRMNNEPEAVKEILQGIERHFAAAGDGNGRAKFRMFITEGINEEPGAAGRILTENLDKFLKDNPETSLLIVIDEADMFIETQLQEYQSRKEACLSFIMGRHIVQHKDSRNLSRIRFLFSGYRVANTREGVWRNWGDSLQLDPLDRASAVQLVSGPFARIGVDMSRHAATIAWRCGYQPAVIMRFGETFLKGKFGKNKEYYRSDNVEIEQVLASKDVTQEIHGIVQGNFQGRPDLQLVFEAFLVETADLPSASDWVIDASQTVASRIVDLDPKGHAKSFSPDKVFELLEELHSRSLLSKGRGGRFRLRYPHHLPLLLPREGGKALRTLYEKDIRNTPEKEDDIDWRGCEMLDRRSIDEIQQTCGAPYSEYGIRAVVAGGEWLSLWENSDAGLLRRLGVKEEQFHLRIDSGKAEQTITSRVASDAPSILLIGDPALLRWGISRKEDVLICGQRRLSLEQTIWWFCHVHLWGLEPKHAKTIHRVTAGIPRFMSQVERTCRDMATPNPDRSNHEAELVPHFEDILRQYEEYTKISVAALARNTDMALSKRERELLAIAVMIKKELNPKDDDDFRDALSFYEPEDFRKSGWSILPNCVDFDSPEDRDGFTLLLELGLLPLKSKSPLGDIFEVLALPVEEDPIVKYWPKG